MKPIIRTESPLHSTTAQHSTADDPIVQSTQEASGIRNLPGRLFFAKLFTMMEYWRGVLKVPLSPVTTTTASYYRVAVSLCLSTTSKSLTVPSANAIFFNGDRVEGTRNPVIERLSDPQNIAEILVSKFGGCVNAWVIEASLFNGPFAVYKDFIPSLNSWGEPRSYNHAGFPASTSTVSLLLNCLEQAKLAISKGKKDQMSNDVSMSFFSQPNTYILGFSKGGTVLNQLVTELGFSDIRSRSYQEPIRGESSAVQIVPNSEADFLNSISEIHYVDVGLNSTGAYLKDHIVIERIGKRLMQGAPGIRFFLHGTPRQWSDSGRFWIRNEKDKLVGLLEHEAQKSGGKLQVYERLYFADRSPGMQMHFEIIENMDVT